MVDIKSYQNWEALYRDVNVKELPWYYKQLDHDMKNAIKSLNIRSGNILDLGTGPGTQAIQLADLGLKVTATDISESAISKARKLSNKVKFLQDNILETELPANSFDYIFDRGCLHTMHPSSRQLYIKNINKILKKNGLLFLKTFSNLQPGNWGPYRFSQENIIELFSHDFKIINIKHTTYKGTLEEEPKSLFIIMRKQ